MGSGVFNSDVKARDSPAAMKDDNGEAWDSPCDSGDFKGQPGQRLWFTWAARRGVQKPRGMARF